MRVNVSMCMSILVDLCAQQSEIKIMKQANSHQITYSKYSFTGNQLQRK